jgi:tRNA (uracil-5-)-methyltransferase TRM9
MNKDTTNKILSEIEEGYDLIADKFSSTRAFMWRDLDFIKDIVKSTDKILDFGCGNGRLAGYLNNKYEKYIGLDVSRKLVDIAKKKYSGSKTEFIKLSHNFQKLPLEDKSIDIIISIAVFHHFPSREYALKIAKELNRVLAPGGKIIITVWNLWQEQYLKFHQKSKNEWIDAEIPFKSGETIFDRYHHPFKIEELKELFKEAGFKALKTKKGFNLLYIGKKSAVDK